MASVQKKFVIFNLRETYHELGKFDFKIVLDPRFFKNGHLSDVTLVDSDGKKIDCDVEKWGRKINCVFSVTDQVPDGVTTVNMILRDDGGKELTTRTQFWVIKP